MFCVIELCVTDDFSDPNGIEEKGGGRIYPDPCGYLNMSELLFIVCLNSQWFGHKLCASLIKANSNYIFGLKLHGLQRGAPQKFNRQYVVCMWVWGNRAESWVYLKNDFRRSIYNILCIYCDQMYWLCVCVCFVCSFTVKCVYVSIGSRHVSSNFGKSWKIIECNEMLNMLLWAFNVWHSQSVGCFFFIVKKWTHPMVDGRDVKRQYKWN